MYKLLKKEMRKIRYLLASSIKIKVTVFTLAIFLVGSWSLTVYSSYTLHRDMEKTLSEQQFSTVSILAAGINQKVEEQLKALEGVAARITPAMLADASSTQKFLADRLTLLLMFNAGINVTRLDGVVIADMPVSMKRIGINYSDKNHVAGALKGKSTIGNPVMGKMVKAPIIPIAVPIFNNGKVIGILTGITNLAIPNFLSKVTDNVYGKTGGYLLVSKQARTIVFASDKKRIMEVLPKAGINLLVDRYADDFEGSGITINPVGVEVLSSAKSIPIANWYLVASIPTNEAFEPVHSMQKRMLLATILLTLLSGSLIWWILKNQLAPVFITIKALATLSNTDQSLQLLPITRQDEIGELVSSFNHLLEILEQRKEALRETDQRYRDLFSFATDGIFIMSIDGKLLDVNESFAKMHGYTVAEMLTMRLDDLDTPKTASLIPERMRRILNGELLTFEVEHYHKDGHIFSLEVSTNAIFSSDKQYVQCFHRDITERKKTEEMIRDAEIRYRMLFEHSPDGIVIIDPLTAQPIEFNETAHRQLGYSREEFAKLNISDIDVSETPEETKSHIQRVIDEGFSDFETFQRTKNGKIRNVHVTAQNIEISGRQVYHCIWRDITERKQLEKDLLESERRYRMIADTTSDIITIADITGKKIKFSYVSPSVLRVRGFTVEEALKQTLEQIVTPDSLLNMVAILREELELEAAGTANPQRTRTVEIEEYCKDGSIISLESNSTFLRDQNKKPIGIVSVSRDITQRKLAEEKRREIEAQLEQIDKMEAIGTLAGGIAHDFNNLLTGIMGNISIAQQEDDLEESSKLLHEAIKAVERATSLTQQLLTFAKGGIPTTKITSIAEVIEESAKFAIGKNSASYCEIVFPDDFWAAEIDSGQIGQVVQNLVINSVEAMPMGGKIKIGGENVEIELGNKFNLMPGSYVHFWVKDSGIGIQEGYLKKIFEPFFSTKRKSDKNSGLGLAVSYNIVRKHAGHISVNSKQGRGTTFHIYLPAIKERLREANTKSSIFETPTGLKILVMDDEEMIRNVLESMLKIFGHQVELAENGEMAVEKYKQAFVVKTPFNLVILDLTIPGGMNGVETLSRIQEIDPRVKAIVSSGYSETLPEGFAGKLPKPYKMETVQKVIGELFGKSSL